MVYEAQGTRLDGRVVLKFPSEEFFGMALQILEDGITGLFGNPDGPTACEIDTMIAFMLPQAPSRRIASINHVALIRALH